MKYHSTRSLDYFTFKQALFRGLAEDGGLFIPDHIPTPNYRQWETLDFPSLATEIFMLFIDDIPKDVLHSILKKSFASFTHPLTTPLKPIANKTLILELFHGPTFAFKDVALQVLGNLFEHYLEPTQKITVLGATRYFYTTIPISTIAVTLAVLQYTASGAKETSNVLSCILTKKCHLFKKRKCVLS
jgi:threonine synthase